ncbi:MAG TPA: hypothetical protein VK400_18055, partial [Pyrinomonadaceae bacterium]|nr:hypothetical protein [Pyrinomonadaceae bacterium]
MADKLISQNLEVDEIYGFCFLQAEIYLDYYGCNGYLNFDESDVISSREFFPACEDGEFFF